MPFQPYNALKISKVQQNAVFDGTTRYQSNDYVPEHPLKQ
jgi:hypothetical protein